MLFERIANRSWSKQTIPELFHETCQLRKNKVALVFQGQKITFNELNVNVQKAASMLIGMGIKPGDRVTLLPTTRPEFIYLYLGIIHVGAVYNVLNLLWGENEIRAILERNDPKVIVTIDEHKGKNFIELIKNSIPELSIHENEVSSKNIPSLTHMIQVSEQGENYIGFHAYEEEISKVRIRPDEILERVKLQKGTDTQIMYQTSGSTGVSKTVLLDQRTPLAAINFGAKNTGFTEEDSYINFSPMFHVGGLFAINLNLVYAGTTLYIMDSFSPLEALQLIDENHITTTFAFAAHLQGIKQLPKFYDYNFTIKKMLLAGDPKAYDLAKEMCRHDDVVVNMLFGQTEHCGLIGLGEHDCCEPKLQKYFNGRPLPGVEVIIKDIHTGEILPDHQPGEICYRSPLLFKGYYKQPDKTSKAIDENGFFHSGDYGTLEFGHIRFLGRLGGVIKSGGENVSTYRVNLQLIDLFPDEIEDVQSLGIPDDYWGTKLIAWIRKKEGNVPLSTEDLKKRCKGKMADYEIPKDILLWDGEWPVSAEGKINQKLLIQRAIEILSNKPVH
ncbi:acyl--CoA ligase [Mesobacillus maritimus]|uniref:class I adenylate-forming enzyme family protein n=1 Tax=Mesobacillus maritimus TaxID=1643336 RepID=UPI00203B3DCA|nr:class I adenylate-forming enzyme family protein [Mesobacillus maritimus]MCM3669362.1 acyl--CoA ligase [Mesobacillus maritimus]